MQLEFTAVLKKSNSKGGWTYAVLPDGSSEILGTRGYAKVKGTIDGRPIEGSVMARGNGSQMLPINAGLRKILGKQKGDTVNVALEKIN